MFLLVILVLTCLPCSLEGYCFIHLFLQKASKNAALRSISDEIERITGHQRKNGNTPISEHADVFRRDNLNVVNYVPPRLHWHNEINFIP